MIELTAYITTFLLSFVTIKLVLLYAKKLQLIDTPNLRSTHVKTTPSGAGIGFILSVFISLYIFQQELFLDNWYIFVAIFMVYVIGILDDRHNAPPRAKFVIIATASLLLVLNGLEIDSLGTYFGVDVPLYYFALPFTIFAITGFSNALNLIDGLDALAASIAIVTLGTFAYIGSVYNDQLIVQLSLFTIASLLAFLLFNWNPAKIFMGDSGSLSLGFIIAIVAVLSLKYIHPITVLYIAAIPILDTIVVMVRRLNQGKSPFKADKTHIHHVLLGFFKNNVKKTVVFMTLMQLMFCFFGYILARHIANFSGGLLPFGMLVGFVILVVLSYMVFTRDE
ncbi:MAG: undecaprenyl/decaprenyl-phosphate alpha-N-acetylglucosaminyl 1-phosphate transferase [Helicobacteraceae bacterium]|nr:undecaprenyl/decaprenyl-phosphate alpha-N-acetylglucosaminyl 1-phosphate transferase [Helicobacteraceae bacterium]